MLLYYGFYVLYHKYLFYLVNWFAGFFKFSDYFFYYLISPARVLEHHGSRVSMCQFLSIKIICRVIIGCIVISWQVNLLRIGRSLFPQPNEISPINADHVQTYNDSTGSSRFAYKFLCDFKFRRDLKSQ